MIGTDDFTKHFKHFHLLLFPHGAFKDDVCFFLVADYSVVLCCFVGRVLADWQVQFDAVHDKQGDEEDLPLPVNLCRLSQQPSTAGGGEGKHKHCLTLAHPHTLIKHVLARRQSVCRCFCAGDYYCWIFITLKILNCKIHIVFQQCLLCYMLLQWTKLLKLFFIHQHEAGTVQGPEPHSEPTSLWK